MEEANDERTPVTNRTTLTSGQTSASQSVPTLRPFPTVDGIRHSFVEIGGPTVHVAEAGIGDPVLALHGFPQHWYAWRHVIPRLADDYHLICPDRRGAGWSDAPRSGYSTEAGVDDLLALMDALGLERVRLIGHQSGAWIGFNACLRAPERFSHFLALNMIHPWPAQRSLVLGAWRQWYTALIEYPGLGAWVLRTKPGLVRYLLRHGVTDPSIWTAGDLDEFVAVTQEPARARAGQAMHWQFVLHDIPRLATRHYRHARLIVPTRLLFGAEDFAVSPRVLAGGEAHADDLRITVVPGVGQLIVDERPDVVADAARSFFKVSP